MSRAITKTIIILTDLTYQPSFQKHIQTAYIHRLIDVNSPGCQAAVSGDFFRLVFVFLSLWPVARAALAVCAQILRRFPGGTCRAESGRGRPFRFCKCARACVRSSPVGVSACVRVWLHRAPDPLGSRTRVI